MIHFKLLFTVNQIAKTSQKHNNVIYNLEMGFFLITIMIKQNSVYSGSLQ